ncbi:MAG: hypothetical protein PHE20_01850 [Patescibacteria group bacterium]|nr:hypothetical protein [Patescibacteria group bacterium]
MTDKDRVKKEANLNKYEDLEGMTLNKMKLGLWLSLNRKRIWRFTIIALMAVSALMLIYSTYHYAHYFLYGRQADKDLLSEVTSNQIDVSAYREATSPTEMLIGNISTFSVQGKYDFLIPVSNPNLKHTGFFKYCLQDEADNNILCESNFILPGANKNIIIVGQKLSAKPQNLKLVVSDLFWQRLNAHNIPDWQAYQNEHLNLQISNLKYTAPENGSKSPFHTLSFTATNFSSYHLARLPLDILLYNGNSVSGVNIYNLDNFLSGEARDLSFSWLAAGERVSRVEIIPDANLLDAQIYLPYQGEVQP